MINEPSLTPSETEKKFAEREDITKYLDRSKAIGQITKAVG